MTVLYTVNPSCYTNAQRFAFLLAARVENLNGRRPQARDIARLTNRTCLKKFVQNNNRYPHVDDFWHLACHLRDCGLLAPWTPFTSNGIAWVTPKGVRWLLRYAPDLMRSIEQLRSPAPCCSEPDEDCDDLPW
jgi:hypothetical protein